jgi:hypothetical protein
MKPVTEDLSSYRKWGMTLLQLMGALALAGIVGTVLLQWLFA